MMDWLSFRDWWSQRAQRKHFHSYSAEFTILTLLLLAGLLVWVVHLRLVDFRTSQDTIIQNTMLGVINGIAGHLDEQKRALGLFAKDNQDILSGLMLHPRNRVIQRRFLENKMADWFPRALGYAITDWEGEASVNQLPGDGRDLLAPRQVLAELRQHGVALYPIANQPFYILATGWGMDQREGYLLVAFEPSRLGVHLRRAQLNGYEVLLAQREQDQEIWFSARGRGIRALRERETTTIAHDAPLEGTRWDLIARYPKGLLENYKTTIISQMLMIFFVFSAISLGMWLISSRIEHRRRASAEALEASEARYRAIVQDQTELICRFDPKGRLRFVNAAYCRYFGRDATQLLGTQFTDHVLPADVALASQEIAALGAERQTITAEHRGVMPDAQVRWQQWVYRAMLDDFGRVEEIQAVGRDITAYKDAVESMRLAREEAEAAARAKSDFLANMSHEIRTPMNGVLGMTELLLKTRLDERQQQYTATIHRSAESLLSLINDILDFSKMEAGKLVLHARDFQLEEHLIEVVRLLRVEAEAKGLRVQVRYAPDAPRWIHGDAERIRQMVINLLGNAIKFTAQGHIRLEVRGEDVDGVAMLAIRVADTGIGIAPGQLRSIFEKFTQADASSTREYGGTGLGLAITNHLAKLMDGWVEVTSDPGHGSVFTLRLALARADACPEPPLSPELARERVLLIAGEAWLREILHEQLMGLPIPVEAVATLEAGIARVRAARDESQPFWLVLIGETPEWARRVGLATWFSAEAGIQRDTCIAWIADHDAGQGGEVLAQRGFCASMLQPLARQDWARGLNQLWRARQQGTPGWVHLGFPDSPSQDETPKALAEEANGGERALRVLLVEDSEVNRLVALNMLDELHCQVDVAENGEAGVAAWADGEYDLILMDLQMPVMDGLAATREIRRREGEPSIPIVAVTANAMRGDQERCEKAGMDGYISKPYTAAQLRAVVEQYRPTLESTTTPLISVEEPEEETQPLFDQAQLRRVVMGNAMLLKRIVAVFTTDSTEQMTEIETLITQNGDRATLERSLHSLKGEARNLGAMRLGEAAYEGEQAVKQNDRAQLAALPARLRAEHQALLQTWAAVDWDTFL